MDDSCAVCAEALEWVAYGACGHREVCSTCVVRLRFVMDDKRCCICKSDCATVFVTKAMGDYTRVMTDFSVFPPDATEGQNGSYWYHEDTQAYFDDLDHYKMIKAMCRLSCSVCDRAGPDGVGSGGGPARRRNRFRSIEQLKGHLFHQHKLHMCNLCLEGRKVFICEQKLYTRTQLQQHIKTGDSEVDGTEEERSGFSGHPMCEFCKSPFYGDNELYMHMSTEHYTCHICQRQHPGQYDYYRNYDDLEVHFRQEHFLCENEECLAKKFVVFQNEQELKRHNALEHGGHMSRAQRNAALQIPTSFRYRRSEQEQRRGGRFSGGRGRNFRRDTSNDIETSYRDHGDSVAASLESVSLTSSRPEQVLEQSSFPPLSDPSDVPDLRPGSTTDPPDNWDSSASRYALALNQNSRSTNSLREESFPPLPGVSNRGQPGTNHAPQQGLQSLARNTLAARLQQRSKGTIKVIHPRSRQPDPPFPSLHVRDSGSIPGLNPAPNSAWSNSTSTSAGTSTGSSSNKFKQSTPVSNLNQAGPSVNSSASVSPSIPNGAPVPPPVPVDVRNANKSLVERIRAGLGNDEERYTLFKGISAEYRQGDIGMLEYLSYVEQFGLSHLVPELARLLPDLQKQKELTEAYYANLRLKNMRESSTNGAGNSGTGNGGSSSKSSKKGKGKDAAADNFLETVRKLQADQRSAQEEEKVEVLSKDGYRASTKGKTVISQHPGESSNTSDAVEDKNGTKQRSKKSSKFLRVRLGDGSAAALLDVGRTSADTSPERGAGTNNVRGSEGSMPVRGVWKNGGGQRLAKDLFK
ncbi:zinc ion binding/nucleic acid binding protein [Rhynchospora pubera]|uniref:RING-type E3 ubiquitin transferase n=1 Tax=Rhynchospora pubera TaxID=906938 RepID=A0AAV8EPS7_9POAL|nr:zinc ion binding/nucleic acid binding protein [Rhynchospora pubera]